MNLWNDTAETSGGNLNRADSIAIIKECYKRTGNFPTVRQLMAELGITSTGAMTYHLNMLLSTGAIKRVEGRKGFSGCYTLPEVLEALKSL